MTLHSTVFNAISHLSNQWQKQIFIFLPLAKTNLYIFASGKNIKIVCFCHWLDKCEIALNYG